PDVALPRRPPRSRGGRRVEPRGGRRHAPAGGVGFAGEDVRLVETQVDLVGDARLRPGQVDVRVRVDVGCGRVLRREVGDVGDVAGGVRVGHAPRDVVARGAGPGDDVPG